MFISIAKQLTLCNT